ncbi:hypothetical protein NDU88_001332 [Pleurodeles waltl]|uniref:Uncharacterized protein n=1 Tax=Pleurodeles waltl TaxID=8319 RepID=A0AAV7P6V3_PLEWA|nr:hypothetical protein NDU88_001332 [Pleurodeles waltl]
MLWVQGEVPQEALQTQKRFKGVDEKEADLRRHARKKQARRAKREPWPTPEANLVEIRSASPFRRMTARNDVMEPLHVVIAEQK